MNGIQKAAALLTLVLALPVAAATTLEDFSPHFPTNTQIIWKAPTNNLPATLTVFKAVPPHIFSNATISNAIVLASLQDKGFKWSARKELCIDYDTCPCGHPCTFLISPKRATLAYSSPNHQNGSSADIPADDALKNRALDFAMILGLDQTQLSSTSITTNFCDNNEFGLRISAPCGYSLTLSRLIEGIDFYGDSVIQGFELELGSGGQVRSFCLIWPNLAPIQHVPIASTEQIIASIRASKTPVMPHGDETNYFNRVKSLANAKKLTITSIRPHYMEGIYGELPQEGQELPNVLTPVAELQATAELDTGTVKIVLFSPLASTDVSRLLTPNSHNTPKSSQ